MPRYINDDFELSDTKVYARTITIDELRKMITNYWETYNESIIDDETAQEKAGYTFGTDNVIDDTRDNSGDNECVNAGFHTTDDGLTYCGFYSWGDEEFSIFGIIYCDIDNNLQLYIPTRGNFVIPEYKCVISAAVAEFSDTKEWQLLHRYEIDNEDREDWEECLRPNMSLIMDEIHQQIIVK